MSMLKGAVTGIRGIGKWHGQMLRDTGRIAVTAICDVDGNQKEAALKEFPDARFYTDQKALLAAERPDVVVLATPHHLHAPLAIEALGAGAAVVVEKPMATTFEDAAAMIAAARRAGRALTVFHNRRLDPWFLAARDAIQENVLGQVFEINIGIGYGAGSTTWRGFKKASGGILFDWGAHLVDYALHFDPGEVRAVSGFLWRRPDADPEHNEDHGSLRIHFASGTAANVTVSARDFKSTQRFRILGTRATLLDDWSWGEDGKLKIHGRLAAGEAVEMDVAYRKSRVQDFYDNVAAHLLDGAPLMVSPESAARVINVLCTAERSSLAGGAPQPLAPAS